MHLPSGVLASAAHTRTDFEQASIGDGCQVDGNKPYPIFGKRNVHSGRLEAIFKSE